MKCQVCGVNFNSLVWYEFDEGNKEKLVLCDSCMLDIYKGKRRVTEVALGVVEERIEFLENKLKE